MQHTELQGTKAATAATTVEPCWYHAYYLALLEQNRERAMLKIECAQQAIHERVAELEHEAPDNAREPQDLRNALTYLGILLQHIGRESGNVLWD